MLILSIPYVEMKPHIDFLKTKTRVYHIDYWRIGFYMHVFSSVFLMVAGAMQFIPYLIYKAKKIHRISGYTYIFILLLISGPGAIVMSIHANGGIYAQTSFLIQSILWYVTTILAWYFATKKKFNLHSEWMVRSYALTLGAISLRLFVVIFGMLNIDELRPKHVYIIVSWSSWVVNLIIAELIIRTGLIKKIYFKKIV